ncbi:hypothetical protein [Helicobacter sp.]|uniref:hypothetical protein n=1 Tax=Helicobacter sp. TaxID=218 RepID=UPI0025C6DBE5|nr:hypothetical protein [Helicobacter sp.]MBR2495565.1 hypothetical protein [Helicobacter sp.]
MQTPQKGTKPYHTKLYPKYQDSHILCMTFFANGNRFAPYTTRLETNQDSMG